MRKILITFAILVAFIAAMSILWTSSGRYLSMFLDQFQTNEINSTPINSIAYQGTGTGGVLRINDRALSLNTPNAQNEALHIGSTKDNQLGLAITGKVFALGPLRATSDNAADTLAAEIPAGDNASMTIRSSALSWPTLFNSNFVTGRSPSWKRHQYYDLTWKKQSGAKLEMVWRYEQYFYPSDGWADGLMTREGSTGLIRVDISAAAR